MRDLIYTCVLLLIFLPGFSLAETQKSGVVTTIDKGQPAPFSGTLFDSKAAANLLTEIKYSGEVCSAEKKRELGLLRSQLELKFDNLKAECDALSLRHTEILKIKDAQIDYLQDLSVAPKWYESDSLWFSAGVVSGILITIAAAYAVGQVTE